MTREGRKTFTLLKKDLPKIIRPLLKPFGFHLTSGRVWVKKDDMLYIMIPLINANETAFLHTSFLAKPVFVDDYLWDILRMEENKAAPFSLRVKGAFTMPPVRFHVCDHPLHTLDTGELVTALREDMEYLSTHITSKELSWFYEMEAKLEQYPHSDTMCLILLLHNNKHDEAAAYIRQHSLNGFIINGKSFRELAEEYCRRQQ